MNTSVPWSIKDISFDTREAAKDAARRAGVSLGEWLDTIIAERASDLGVETSRIDNRQRLDAVAAELRRLAGRTAGLEMQFDDEDNYAATGTDGGSQARPQVTSAPRSAMDPLQMMSERLAAFERRAESPASQSRPTSDPSLGAERLPDRPVSASKSMSSAVREAVAEISRRQAVLEASDASADAAAAASMPANPAPAMADAAERQRWREHVAADGETEELAALRRSNQMVDQGPREPVGLVTPEPRAEVPDRAAPRPPAESPDTASIFETLRRDLRDAIKEIDPRPSVEGLDRQMRDIGRKVEGIGAVMPPSAVLSDIGEQTRQVRDLLTTAASRPPGVDLVQRQMADLHDRMSELRTASPPPSSLDDESWTQMRALFDRVPSGSTIESLDRRMRELSAKIDSGIAEPAPSRLLEDLSRRVDEIQTSIKRPSTAAVDTRPLESLVKGIADRIDDARIATADFQHLEQLMGTLAAKMETGANPVDTHRLESQISRLGDRLDRSEASLSALDTVEHTLGELFSQLEETRHAAINAAETAARTAARDTLRAAMQSHPASTPDGQPGLSEQLSQTLTEVRQHYQDSDRRTQSTLLGLHQTMEKLVEHLAGLNVGARRDEMAAGRTAALDHAEEEDLPRASESGGAPMVQAEPAYQERFRQERANRRSAKVEDVVDSLIEPGAGRSFRDAAGPGDPPVRKVAVPVALPAAQAVAAAVREGEGPASYIAAARRAAQAAQASAAAQKQTKSSRVAGEARHMASAPVLERARQFIAQRRRPILLSLAGLVLLLGALEVVKVGFEDTSAMSRMGATETMAPVLDRSGVPGKDSGAIGPIAAIPHPDVTMSPDKADPTSGTAGRPASADSREAGPAGKSASPAPAGNPFLAGASAPSEGLSDNLRKLAASGDAAAEYEVGLRYAEGRTVSRDPKVAASWFDKAAAQGLAPAQYRIGSAYEKGIGVTRDPALAMAWYGRAAEAGNVKAMHNLAVMAADGSAGKSDYAKAAAWFAKAAGHGIRDSQFNLAILYAKGLGIEQSLAQSYTWFAIAASQGDDDAGKKRDEVATKLDAKTLGAAKAAADAFRPQASISAANEVASPPGGWDGADASSIARPSAAPPKGTVPKISVM